MLRAVVWKVTGDPHRGTIVAGWGGRVVARAGARLPVRWQLRAAASRPTADRLPARRRHRGVPVERRDRRALSARVRRRLPSLRGPRPWRAVPSPSRSDLPLAEAVRRAQEAQAGSIVVARPRPARPIGVVNEAAAAGDPRGPPGLGAGQRGRPHPRARACACRPTSPARTLILAISARRPTEYLLLDARRQHLRRARRPPTSTGPSRAGVAEPCRSARRPDTRVRADAAPHVPTSPEAWSGVHRGPLRAGEWVRLTDTKGRRHNICLERRASGSSPTAAHIDHDDLIGRDGGLHASPRPPAASTSCSGRCSASSWSRCRAVPRWSTPRTPPRSSRWPTSSRAPDVVEAGVGSGALTCSLLRAVGPHGAGVVVRAPRGVRRRRPRRTSTQFFGGRPPGLAAHRRRPRRGAPASDERRRPGRSSTCSRPWECVDRRRRGARARRHRLRVRRHHHPARPDRRDAARARRLHRAAALGDAGPRLARRGPRGPARATR